VRHVRAVLHSPEPDPLSRSRYDEGVELSIEYGELPGRGTLMPGNMQGLQISQTQREKVLGLIRSGIDSGARLVTGGGIPEHLPTGYYVSPTLLADVDPDAQVAQEEIFGPVLTVTAYDTEDDAVSIANNSIYGLSGEVSSADVDRALGVAKRMRTGNVTINGIVFLLTQTAVPIYIPRRLVANGDEGFREYLRARRSACPGERSLGQRAHGRQLSTGNTDRASSARRPIHRQGARLGGMLWLTRKSL
jgi:acyl-CoA reductase-like NAD-dependent aldehyde dehydrogenase